MKKIFGALAVLALVFLVGCGSQQTDDDMENTTKNQSGVITYDCQGEEVQVKFDNEAVPAIAELLFINRENVAVALPQVEAATGVKYSDGNVIFWTQEEGAMLTMEDSDKSLDCMVADLDSEMIDEEI